MSANDPKETSLPITQDQREAATDCILVGALALLAAIIFQIRPISSPPFASLTFKTLIAFSLLLCYRCLGPATKRLTLPGRQAVHKLLAKLWTSLIVRLITAVGSLKRPMDD